MVNKLIRGFDRSSDVWYGDVVDAVKANELMIYLESKKAYAFA